MTCKDCGHAVSVNKMCETPLRSAADILKHMASYNSSHAFASVEPVPRREPELLPMIELGRALGVPAEVECLEPPIAKSSPLPAECELFGFSLDRPPLTEAVLTM
jgi:hypothetical protein